MAKSYKRFPKNGAPAALADICQRTVQYLEKIGVEVTEARLRRHPWTGYEIQKLGEAIQLCESPLERVVMAILMEGIEQGARLERRRRNIEIKDLQQHVTTLSKLLEVRASTKRGAK